MGLIGVSRLDTPLRVSGFGAGPRTDDPPNLRPAEGRDSAGIPESS